MATYDHYTWCSPTSTETARLYFRRRTKQFPLARKMNVLGHLAKRTSAHSFLLSSSVFPSHFFWILAVVDLWILLLVEQDINKSNFVLFHPIQRKILKSVTLFINNQSLTEEHSIRYLGIYIDSNLNWKRHINYIAKKVKRSIGTLSKLRYYLNSKTLLDLYYALVSIFNILYNSLGQYLSNFFATSYCFAKKAIRIITFSSFFENTSPLFKDFNVIKLFYEVTVHIAVFMYKFKKPTSSY